MFEQRPERDTDELPLVVKSTTIVPGPTNSVEEQIDPLKPEIAEVLKNLNIHIAVPTQSHIPKKDLQDPVEIYFIEETNEFWIRCCACCIPNKNKPEAIKLLAYLGVTTENSEFSDSLCLSCTCDEYGPKEEEEAIRTITSELANSVQN